MVTDESIRDDYVSVIRYVKIFLWDKSQHFNDPTLTKILMRNRTEGKTFKFKKNHRIRLKSDEIIVEQE